MSSNKIGERVRKDAIALCQDLVSQERADSVEVESIPPRGALRAAEGAAATGGIGLSL